MRALLVATTVACFAVRATAAADCLTSLHTTGWACHAELSNGQSADFCLEHTNTFGNDPATRFFKVLTTGLQVSTCTCGAKGKSPGAAFGADKSLLCWDPDSDTVTSATVARRKITGQTFVGSLDVRSAFSCRPDPTCDLPPIVEPDLPAVHGAVGLPQPPGGLRTAVAAQGRIDVGYLSGCTGFASEAPTLAVDVQPTVPGQSAFWFDRAPTSPYHAGVVVLAPSGVTYCNDATVSAPIQAGRHFVWVTTKAAGDTVSGELVGVYDQQ
jgi:hypothetical protein